MSTDAVGRLVEARHRKGLTQAELGDMLGAGKTQVSQWERGSAPIPRRHADAVAQILGVTDADMDELTSQRRSQLARIEGKLDRVLRRLDDVIDGQGG